MKKLFRAFFMAVGMFSALPCPYRPWDEDARGMMTACLPLLGAVLGLIWAALSMLARRFLPMPLAAAVIAALPWLLTGFIHLDGFMDASDALLSWQPLEKRLEILKDPHAGAFAVISLGVLMLLSYGAAHSLSHAPLRTLVLVPVISRCGSALSVLTLAPLGHSQYARVEGSAAQRAAVIAICLISLAIGAIWLGRGALIVLLAECAVYAAAMVWAMRTLGGVSGDLAGFALSASECAALIVLSLV